MSRLQKWKAFFGSIVNQCSHGDVTFWQTHVSFARRPPWSTWERTHATVWPLREVSCMVKLNHKRSSKNLLQLFLARARNLNNSEKGKKANQFGGIPFRIIKYASHKYSNKIGPRVDWLQLSCKQLKASNEHRESPLYWVWCGVKRSKHFPSFCCEFMLFCKHKTIIPGYAHLLTDYSHIHALACGL